jgi:cytochrome c oxidase assembly protein subunit 15
VIPAFTISVIIEFTHRLWTIVVTVLVIATMLLAWRRFRWPNKVTAFATLTFILLLGQIVLGMITVDTRTLPIAVTSHLALATLVFASALTTAVVAQLYGSRRIGG